MKKVFFLLSTVLLLNGCAESVALLGGSIGGASNGKMLQSSLNSAISYGVKKQTGKTPLEHALAYAEEKNPEKKKETCISFVERTRSEFLARSSIFEDLTISFKTVISLALLVFEYFFAITNAFSFAAILVNDIC